MNCPYAISGCNYPQGECSGACWAESRGHTVDPMPVAHSPMATWADKKAYRWPAVAFVISLLVLGSHGLMLAWDEIAEQQAVEEARAAAQRKDELNALQRRALQDQCGGTEATVTAKAGGGYECTNKRGKKFTIPGLARPANTTHGTAARALGARLQREVLKAPFQTKSAGLVPAGFLRSF